MFRFVVEVQLVSVERENERGQVQDQEEGEKIRDHDAGRNGQQKWGRGRVE
jgi:hypothetical protein